MFEILEHTADIGLRARGTTPEEMFTEAALALQSIVVETLDVEARSEYPIAAGGEDYESLIVNWLGEVLYYLDGQRVVFSRIQIERLSSTMVAARGWGEPRDAARHPPRLVVKGITYHELRISTSPGEWRVEVYVDI
jgi:SHS2 domain-containing protein